MKQTVAGHITSFTRGCHYLNNCTDVDRCEREDNKQTGACKSCCGTSLCNGTSHRTHLSLAGVLFAVYTTLFISRLLGR